MADSVHARPRRYWVRFSLRTLLLFVLLWEYACRAGTQTRFSSGHDDSDLDAVAWNLTNSGGTTHPVGLKKPNAFGLYDMHGNVWKWCEDAYMEYCQTLPAIDPINEQGAGRLLRGGSWYGEPAICRSAYRGARGEGYRDFNVGFRVIIARSATPP